MWFIINFVVAFATGEGQLLVWPKGHEKEGVKYVVSLRSQAEVRYWTNRFAKAKANGADALKVTANFEISEKGYPNKKAFTTKSGKFVNVGEEITYYITLKETLKGEDIVDFKKGEGRISTLPEDEIEEISTLPEDDDDPV